jgi:hypothetical protein
MKSVYRKYFKIGVVFWAICFIILLFSYLIVLSPQERLRRMTERKLAETTQQAQSAREAASQKDKLLEQLTKSRDMLKDFVIDREKAANLTFDIGRISTDVEIKSFSSIFTVSEESSKADDYKYINARQISVNFNSSFNKFATFLNFLERRRPAIFIDTFSITRSADSDSGNKVDMKLAVLVEKETETKGATVKRL